MPRAGPIRSPSGHTMLQVIAMLLTADNTPTYRELLMSAIDAICTAGFTSTHRLTSSDNPKG
ncbi:hypothetical protein JR316_0009051 [Psilocybe cubensis]|uniref:Uncharacterized protein n=1 Tax=Psilocybe cubensis TaxID=181762 RepID=A0ACB8GU93_PSICU|nr:hypothetical protein JR316_0009051 [Psilocybe cubensis]KAH9478594.1 hypothetical protein JR316_0009051 [Psilocybe cubensis]